MGGEGGELTPDNSVRGEVEGLFTMNIPVMSALSPEWHTTPALTLYCEVLECIVHGGEVEHLQEGRVGFRRRIQHRHHFSQFLYAPPPLPAVTTSPSSSQTPRWLPHPHYPTTV